MSLVLVAASVLPVDEHGVYACDGREYVSLTLGYIEKEMEIYIGAIAMVMKA